MVTRKTQQGFLQNLIIPALLLVGVVLMGWGQVFQAASNGQAVARSVDTARAQMDQIHKALDWCRVMYPAGDNGTGVHKNLPGSPLDGSWTPVRTIICPGASTMTLWAATRTQLGAPGVHLGEWEYKNIASGVYLRASVTVAGDPDARGVLSQLAARLPVAQKNLTGDTLEILFSN